MSHHSTAYRLERRRSRRMARQAGEPTEYHLIDLTAGESFGGFASLAGARGEARAAGLLRWQIYRGNVRVEQHDPCRPDPVDDVAADPDAKAFALIVKAQAAPPPQRDRLIELAIGYLHCAQSLERGGNDGGPDRGAR